MCIEINWPSVHMCISEECQVGSIMVRLVWGLGKLAGAAEDSGLLGGVYVI